MPVRLPFFVQVLFDSPCYFDAFLFKFDSGGQLLWARSWGGEHLDSGEGLTLVDDGVIVSGHFAGKFAFAPEGLTLETTAERRSWYLARFDGDGTLRWARQHGGNTMMQLVRTASDRSGGTVALGHFAGGSLELLPGEMLESSGKNDILMARFDSEGHCRWARSIAGPESDYGTAIAVDSAGNSYIAGSHRAGTDLDPSPATERIAEAKGVFLMKLDPSGELV